MASTNQLIVSTTRGGGRGGQHARPMVEMFDVIGRAVFHVTGLIEVGSALLPASLPPPASRNATATSA